MTSTPHLYHLADLTEAGKDPIPLLGRVRDRIGSLVTELSAEQLDRTVHPLDIGVRDVVGHVVDVAELVAGGERVNFSRVCPLVASGQEALDAQASVPELLGRWASAWTDLEERLRADPQLGTAVLVDAVTHEHDLRTALDEPAWRDDLSVVAALYALAEQLSARIAEADLPALRITVEQWGTIAGSGIARHCLVADRFEFVRGMAGRRSAAQVARWNWSEDPGAYLSVLSATGSLPAADVRERDPRVPAHLADLDLTH